MDGEQEKKDSMSKHHKKQNEIDVHCVLALWYTLVFTKKRCG